MSGTTASPPSLTVTAGAADQTTLNKRNPFPSLLRSHVGRCEREHVGVCPYVCAAEEREVGEGGKRGGGGDGKGLRGGELEQGGGTGRRRLILSSLPALDGACRGLWHIL